MDTPFCFNDENAKLAMDSSFVNMCHEFYKFIQEKKKNQHSPADSMASTSNFAGTFNASQVLSCISLSAVSMVDWIVDIGASDHMTPYFQLLTKIKHLKKPILVALPNGSTEHISIVGQVQLNTHLTLHHCLFVPEFKYNLLSVGKVLTVQKLIANFSSDCWSFQDPINNTTIVKGKAYNGLCKFQASSSFSKSSNCSSHSLINTTNIFCTPVNP